jgi:hypothetical protein
LFSFCREDRGMRARPLSVALIACLLGAVCLGSARAEQLVRPPAPGTQCRAAIMAAERGTAIPPQLLSAIGIVESGRRDPVSGQLSPWPWTINAEGLGSFYDTKIQAIAAARALQARGVQSIDVGCMQVNLMHHPNAFANLDQAFDPTANAAYAARFLTELDDQTHDWSRAAALYHSATPALAAAYQAQVATAWMQERRLAGGAYPPMSGLPAVPGVIPGLGGALTRGSVPATLPHGPAPVGRGLAAYRAAPILYATRAPVSIRRD